AIFDKVGAAKASAFGAQRHVATFENADIAAYSKATAAEDYETLPVGKLSSLQEAQDRYFATAIVKKSNDRLRLATVAWRKEPLESWRVRAERKKPQVMARVTDSYTLPKILNAPNGCTNVSWETTATNLHH